jgi:hypothetical protein
MNVRSLVFAAFVLLLFGLAGPAAPAQSQVATAPTVRPQRYNKSAEVTVSGTVSAVETQNAGTLPRGIYIVVRSGASTFNVHMGMLSQKSIPFASGAQVTVTGAIVAANGTKIMLAREVRSGSQDLMIRSTNGLVVRPHSIDQKSVDGAQGLQP